MSLNVIRWTKQCLTCVLEPSSPCKYLEMRRSLSSAVITDAAGTLFTNLTCLQSANRFVLVALQFESPFGLMDMQVYCADLNYTSSHRMVLAAQSKSISRW